MTSADHVCHGGKKRKRKESGDGDYPDVALEHLQMNTLRLESLRFFFLLLLAYLSSYHEKATKRCTSSLRSCRPSVYHTKMGEFR